jgi:uncharacterized protein with NRDE domain
MCLIVFANDNSRYVMAVAANRDEQYARPTTSAHFWRDAVDVYGGRDVVARGTWLAISTRGRLAAVTNVRRFGRRQGEVSRGTLCREFVTGSEDAMSYANTVRQRRADYGAFNLLVHDGRALVYVSHDIDAPIVVASGVHAVSNAALDDPWPKVVRSRRAFAAGLSGPESDLSNALFELLANRDVASDQLLPDTGYGIDVERELSPPFIAGQHFGTRSSTVVLWRRDGTAFFEERSFGPVGAPLGVVKAELDVAVLRA